MGNSKGGNTIKTQGSRTGPGICSRELLTIQNTASGMPWGPVEKEQLSLGHPMTMWLKLPVMSEVLAVIRQQLVTK